MQRISSISCKKINLGRGKKQQELVNVFVVNNKTTSLKGEYYDELLCKINPGSFREVNSYHRYQCAGDQHGQGAHQSGNT